MKLSRGESKVLPSHLTNAKLAQVAFTIANFIEENPNNPPVSQMLTHEIVSRPVSTG